jgi:hypothetical protein
VRQIARVPLDPQQAGRVRILALLLDRLLSILFRQA